MNQSMISNEAKEVKPVIVSASRATDIPAFYSDWFINRLKEGYMIKFNPYSKRPYKINFENTRFIVFWTKNPKPIIPYLPVIESLGIDYYFQYTLNDYSREDFEKNVPPLCERIKTFKDLSESCGIKRVVWRFDPLILSDNLSVEILLERLEKTGDEIFGFTKRLVFSFYDNYKKSEINFKKTGHHDIREFTYPQMHEFSKGLSEINKKWGLSLFTCSEEADLSAYGVRRGRCIDPELIADICRKNPEMTEYLSKNSGRDKGQRPLCGCIPSTDTGGYNTCIHQCLYCYAAGNPHAASENFRRISRNHFSESITGSDD